MPTIPNFPAALNDEHHAWHQPASHPGFPTRTILLPNPGSGLEFFTFHRNFIAKFHAWYDVQPNADQIAVAPWLEIPPQLKAQAGWPTWVNDVNRIMNNPFSFASADELGIYIERGIHNQFLHGATAQAFQEPLVATFHSPASTYFYKLHGLVDYWWKRYESIVAERGNTLHVLSVTVNGGLSHTIRYPLSWRWQGWGDVKGATSDPGVFVDVDSAGTPNGELHVCGVTNDGNLWHTIRYSKSYTWQPFFGDVKGATSDPGVFIKVACADVNGQLHVCGVTNNGNLWHTIRYPSSWQPWGDVKGATSDPGVFVDVACANVNGELHVCGVTNGGNLWHTIRYSSSWQPWGDVKGATSDPGFFVRVAAGESASALHVSGVTNDGNLWHTIRYTASWQPFFGSVKWAAGDPGAISSVGSDAVFVS